MTIRSTLARRLMTNATLTRRSRIAVDVEGQVSEAEVVMLSRLAQHVDPGSVIVELGSYRGRSTIALALGAQRGSRNRVFAIDPHEEFVGVLGGTYGPEDMAELYRNIVAAGAGEQIAVVCLPSYVVATGWQEPNVGLLWIDGDHRYDAVRRDLDSWLPHLTDNAVVALHDARTDGVKRAIHEFVDASTFLERGAVENLAWFTVNRQRSEALA